MRIWMRRSFAMLMIVVILASLGVGAAAAEPETAPATEPAATETVPETTASAETAPEETVPGETVAEEIIPETKVYTVDTESEMYRVCDLMAEGMSFDQILVYDATNDEILYSRSNEGDKLYPASITKLFSTYVALQYLDPEEVLTAGDELSLVQPGSSLAWIGRGHQMYVKTVVEAMMLPSGNDAAMILATAAGRRIAGDESISAGEAVQVFVAEMNRMAQELGFERSHFSNPDGFHTGSHYTCLNDMARIAKLALENKTVSRYMRVHEDEVTFVSGQTITWENTNLLLDPEEGFYRSDAIGMKTGYTRQAEYCLMSAFKCTDGRTLVIGAFGYEDEYERFRDVIRLAKACKEQLQLEAELLKVEEKDGTP